MSRVKELRLSSRSVRPTGVKPMLIESDEALAALFRRVKTIALIGASHKPERPSYQVLDFLLREGYDVIPVNPGLAGQTLQGQRVVAALSDIEHTIDMVDVFRDGSALPRVLSETLSIGAPVLWTQLAVRHPGAEHAALERGLDLVVDKCPAQEIPRLRDQGFI